MRYSKRPKHVAPEEVQRDRIAKAEAKRALKRDKRVVMHAMTLVGQNRWAEARPYIAAVKAIAERAA